MRDSEAFIRLGVSNCAMPVSNEPSDSKLPAVGLLGALLLATGAALELAGAMLELEGVTLATEEAMLDGASLELLVGPGSAVQANSVAELSNSPPTFSTRLKSGGSSFWYITPFLLIIRICTASFGVKAMLPAASHC